MAPQGDSGADSLETDSGGCPGSVRVSVGLWGAFPRKVPSMSHIRNNISPWFTYPRFPDPHICIAHDAP